MIKKTLLSVLLHINDWTLLCGHAVLDVVGRHKVSQIWYSNNCVEYILLLIPHYISSWKYFHFYAIDFFDTS